MLFSYAYFICIYILYSFVWVLLLGLLFDLAYVMVVLWLLFSCLGFGLDWMLCIIVGYLLIRFAYLVMVCLICFCIDCWLVMVVNSVA